MATGCAHSNPAPTQAPPTEEKAGDEAERKEGRPSVEEAEALYTELVRRAEAGEAVDFGVLRRAWLHGPAMKPDARREKIPELRRAMFKELREDGDFAVVLARAQEILDIEYVNHDAHRGRRVACEQLKAPCEQLSRTTALGLLRSVVEGGDGESCGTAWPVITIDEEYFVLRMLGAEFKQQELVSSEGNACDAMLTLYKGQEKTFYFEVTEVLMARARQLGRIP